MINGIDYHYFWTHEKAYRRITAEEMNTEAAVSLAETIVSDQMDTYRNAAKKLAIFRDLPSVMEVNSILKYLRSPIMNGLTLGHGEDCEKEIIRLCPKDMIKVNRKGEIYIELSVDNKRKNEIMEKKKQGNPGAAVV